MEVKKKKILIELYNNIELNIHYGPVEHTAKELNIKGYDDTWIAFCEQIEGEVHIAIEKMESNNIDHPTIAHEIIHAKNRIFNWVMQDLFTGEGKDEFEAYLVDYITKQVYDFIYESNKEETYPPAHEVKHILNTNCNESLKDLNLYSPYRYIPT